MIGTIARRLGNLAEFLFLWTAIVVLGSALVPTFVLLWPTYVGAKLAAKEAPGDEAAVLIGLPVNALWVAFLVVLATYFGGTG